MIQRGPPTKVEWPTEPYYGNPGRGASWLGRPRTSSLALNGFLRSLQLRDLGLNSQTNSGKPATPSTAVTEDWNKGASWSALGSDLGAGGEVYVRPPWRVGGQ